MKLRERVLRMVDHLFDSGRADDRFRRILAIGGRVGYRRDLPRSRRYRRVEGPAQLG